MFPAHDPAEVMRINAEVMRLDRQQVIAALMSFDPGFPLDFTREYLETQSTPKLRHLFSAVRLQCDREPALRAA